MNTAFFSQQLSCWLSITVIALLGSELSARAQTPNSNSTESSAKPAIVSSQQTGTPFLIKNSYPEQKAASSTSAPLPGASATSASTLTPDSVKPAATATFGVAQNNTVPTPSPSVVPNPGTNSTPAVPVQVTPAPATPGVPSGAPNFSDVGEDYWAYPFIQTLATKNIIIGFPDGTFRPDKPVSRAEFAAMLQKAFHPQPIRQLSPTGFSDVPADYWGAAAIKSAYEGGYLAGYPNNLFLPNQKIIRVQAIAGLASGLGLSHTGAAADVLNTYYTDAGQVPIYAVNNVAAATQAHLVVNYPDVKTLDPRTALTLSEAVSHLYQALVHLGMIPP
ncbi:MAG: S-layer homology domain-containing protein, partial [Chroococcidiopsidaceae cyanobacterium CP_BM_RX_35]|nr:S-layer homology domain-containing protein [Chroococcidiopsidaceae cyanobacterium CP_BM_RX_35]